MPSTTQKLFVDGNYDKPSLISKQERGLNLFKKNLPLLEPYREEIYFCGAGTQRLRD